MHVFTIGGRGFCAADECYFLTVLLTVVFVRDVNIMSKCASRYGGQRTYDIDKSNTSLVLSSLCACHCIQGVCPTDQSQECMHMVRCS